MLKKTAIILVMLFTFFILPSADVLAAGTDSQIPELNPFCWHKSDCRNIRKQFLGSGANNAELDQGFVSDITTAPCNGGEGDQEWGRCLPAGVTKTAISFGGQDKFSNIGEFILVMYRYLLTIVSIVAVVVIILSGVQWTASAGNSETISTSKKRIGNAVVGLFIAYMSYFILNTINPALVNLRLPQTWMVKPMAQVPEFCSDIAGANEGKIKFAFVADWTQPKNVALPPPEKREYVLKSDKVSLVCGSQYLAENGGETTCRGDGCLKFAAQGLTSCFDKVGDGTKYECGNVKIGGKISYTGSATLLLGDFLGGGLSLDWTHPPINSIGAVLVCRNSNYLDLRSTTDLLNKEGADFLLGFANNVVDNYFLDITDKKIDNAVAQCMAGTNVARGDASSVVRGIVLIADMQSAFGSHGGTAGIYSFDETHYIGRNATDLGNSNFFVKNYDKISSRYFFTTDEVKKGLRLNINADSIVDVNAGKLINSSERQDKANTLYQKVLFP